jgi:hypothetical protein
VLEKCAKETPPEDPAFMAKCSKEIETVMKIVIKGIKQPLIDYYPVYNHIMKFWANPPPDPFKRREEYQQFVKELYSLNEDDDDDD